MRGDVLITGARGFVGRHAVERASEHGLRPVPATVDLRERERVRRLVADARPAAVIHLAYAKSADAGRHLTALAENLTMAANLLEAVETVTPGIPVLIPGSAAEYGMGGPDPLGETAPVDPISPYGAAKAVLEAACLSGSLTAGARVIWTRSFNHVGPGQGLDAPVPSWARQIALAERSDAGVVKTGRLDAVRDFLDVRDVADAYLELIESEAEGVVNVSSGEGTPLRAVAEALVGLAGIPLELVHDPDLERATDPPQVVGDPGRLRALTGWKPTYTLERSLQDVLDEWRERVRDAEPRATVTPRA
jgi:GDP-4-dehydro-6-deoxy-D-mannose reductase